MCIALLTTSCQKDNDLTPASSVLELELSRAGRPLITTRAVDNDLTVDIYNKQNSRVGHYQPGSVPSKIVLEPGEFRLVAYTDNQTTWTTANGGKGAGCFYADTIFTMEDDMVFRLKLDVPMTNYAVGLSLPEHFHTYFPTYTFTLSSGGRTTTIQEGEKAYFDVADKGFTYALWVTNSDNTPHSHSALEYNDIQAGKLFTIRYSYDSDATTGGVDIIITDDMEPDNNGITL